MVMEMEISIPNVTVLQQWKIKSKTDINVLYFYKNNQDNFRWDGAGSVGWENNILIVLLDYIPDLNLFV